MKKKLVLNIEQLEVESFAVHDGLRDDRGTIRGQVVGDPEPIGTDATCGCTAYGDTCTWRCRTPLCDLTKAYTCPWTCGEILCIRVD